MAGADRRKPALPDGWHRVNLPIPFADRPIFPFEGDVRVKAIAPRLDADVPRSGEPGGQPCESCAADNDDYIWIDDHWRVRGGVYPAGVPVQVFLETRYHVDMDGLKVSGRVVARASHA